MKKLILLLMVFIFAVPVLAQENRSRTLENLETGQGMQQQSITATTRSAARLFREVNDLTSVITIIPKGAEIIITGSDSSYYRAEYEGSEGYILRRHVEVKTAVPPREQPAAQQERGVQTGRQSRFSYLEQKYGTSTAARINSGKIWKGMDAEMVKDSWGSPQSINRTISGNTMKEEWRYKNTLLYFRDNMLVDWGPVQE